MFNTDKSGVVPEFTAFLTFVKFSLVLSIDAFIFLNFSTVESSLGLILFNFSITFKSEFVKFPILFNFPSRFSIIPGTLSLPEFIASLMAEA